jgi:hypothetical protein
MRTPFRAFIFVYACYARVPLLLIDADNTVFDRETDKFLLRKVTSKPYAPNQQWMLPSPLRTWYSIETRRPIYEPNRRWINPTFDYSVDRGMFKHSEHKSKEKVVAAREEDAGDDEEGV